MNIDTKATKLMAKLNRETSMGNITWISQPAPDSITDATEDIVYLYFETMFKEKRFALYERRYRHYVDEDEFHWSSDAVMAILDNNLVPIWEFNKSSPALRDLWNTVREQVANIDDLLDDLLENDT